MKNIKKLFMVLFLVICTFGWSSTICLSVVQPSDSPEISKETTRDIESVILTAFYDLDEIVTNSGVLYDKKYFKDIGKDEVAKAADLGYAEYRGHMQRLRDKGAQIIQSARAAGKRIIVLAGRPYHVDPEVNHGIDGLICRHGAAVVTEDSVAWHMEKFPTTVLNQWTYHSRLYAAAKYCTTQPDMDLVQLVSFGCGVDAITTDETRSILQAGGKLYTQLKIDEITNLGAVNIRLRSLFAALDEKQRKGE